MDAGFSATQQGTQRALARSGITPGSARSMTMMQDLAGEQAKARASAGIQATRNIEQQGYARRMDAAGMGQGVFGGQATMQNVATQAGNSSVGNSRAGLDAAMSGAGLMQSGFNTTMQGKQIAGNLTASPSSCRPRPTTTADCGARSVGWLGASWDRAQARRGWLMPSGRSRTRTR